MSSWEPGEPGLARPVFDAHFHVIDPQFALVPNNGFVPDAFTVDDYRDRVAGLGVVGGAVVSGSFQAFDSGYLVDALARLGPGFVGVAQLPASATEEDVRRLDAAGVRAVRWNLVRGGSVALDQLDAVARRVHDVAGWHVECYLDASGLGELGPRLAALPTVVIDHLGLSADGFEHLRRAVERGVYVKASGFGRVDLDVAHAVREIARVNPGGLLFGTDLPGTRAPRPFEPGDVELLVDALGDERLVHAALYGNAVRLYRPYRAPSSAAAGSSAG